MTFFFSACSKDLHFSGISENRVNQISKDYLKKDYTKEDINLIIGAPIIQEDSGNLWIYRLKKQKGNTTFRKTIYNKTLKLKFEKNILRSVEEINID